MLVLFCVSRLNYQVSEVGNFKESPRVLFSGRQTDGKLDFRVGFGDYVQCTVANTNNTMDARTEDCIAMVPTGSRAGSVKMMSLSTGKMVTRDQFRILPMPLSVINRLNEMALAEGKKIVRRTKMPYDVEGGCGRTGYTGPTGRTGPRHDPPDPSAYSTHRALPRLAS